MKRGNYYIDMDEHRLFKELRIQFPAGMDKHWKNSKTSQFCTAPN